MFRPTDYHTLLFILITHKTSPYLQLRKVILSDLQFIHPASYLPSGLNAKLALPYSLHQGKVQTILSELIRLHFNHSHLIRLRIDDGILALKLELEPRYHKVNVKLDFQRCNHFTPIEELRSDDDILDDVPVLLLVLFDQKAYLDSFPGL